METETRKCKRCSLLHSAKEVKRVNGEHSAVYLYGYCSARCYTKDKSE